MSDDKLKPTWARSRRGRPNRNSRVVAHGLEKLHFDGVTEWVRAFAQLEELYQVAPNEEKLPLLEAKFSRLEKLFKFVYPTLKETDVEAQEAILLEKEKIEIEGLSTDLLLEASSKAKDGSED